ncbi:hypothetical protein U1Q18_015049 [Sarracenia purpurea var. burkii]
MADFNFGFESDQINDVLRCGLWELDGFLTGSTMEAPFFQNWGQETDLYITRDSSRNTRSPLDLINQTHLHHLLFVDDLHGDAGELCVHGDERELINEHPPSSPSEGANQNLAMADQNRNLDATENHHSSSPASFVAKLPRFRSPYRNHNYSSQLSK